MLLPNKRLRVHPSEGGGAESHKFARGVLLNPLTFLGLINNLLEFFHVVPDGGDHGHIQGSAEFADVQNGFLYGFGVSNTN